MAYFKEISWNLPRRTEENHKIPPVRIADAKAKCKPETLEPEITCSMHR
jgi:hypothetical protein